MDADAVLVEFVQMWLWVGRGGLLETIVVEWALNDSTVGRNGGVGGWSGGDCLWDGDGWRK